MFRVWVRVFLMLFGVLVLLLVILGGALFYDAYLLRPAFDAQAVTVTIDEGRTAGSIASELERNGIISSPMFFLAYAKLTDNIDRLQAGMFELKPGMSLRAVVSALTDARAQEVEVTIPEGFTVAQIGERVREALPGISQEQWEQAVGATGVAALNASDVTAGIPSGQGLEGYLFPDTYRFRNDADAQTVVQTMHLTLLRRLAQDNIVPPTVLEKLEFEGGLTLHEVLTLASILEHEVRTPEDMKLVAGIFFTRLKIGMALQADSTINYITGKQDAAVTLEDSRVDSPYNTYQRLGLPPGPIDNPGLNAIRAVFGPTDSDFLYFLTTDDGQVVYAKTFDEHIANKYKYLK